MTRYRQAHSIYVGQWRFYPELTVAQNMHNGARAFFTHTPDGEWIVSCTACPATWMLKELAEWFALWISGCATRPT